MLVEALCAHGLKAAFSVIPRVASGDWYDTSGSGERAFGDDLADMLRQPAAAGALHDGRPGFRGVWTTAAAWPFFAGSLAARV